MKILMIFVMAAAVSIAADKKPSNSKSSKQKAEVVTVPVGAVPTDDGSFRYTDKQGKKWLYRSTPFGVSRVEDKPAPQVEPEAVDQLTKAVESGDTVRFERPGPFGPTRWEKKKTELDASEQAVLDRQKHGKEK